MRFCQMEVTFFSKIVIFQLRYSVYWLFGVPKIQFFPSISAVFPYFFPIYIIHKIFSDDDIYANLVCIRVVVGVESGLVVKACY